MTTFDIDSYTVPDGFQTKTAIKLEVRSPRMAEDIKAHPSLRLPSVIVAKVKGGKVYLVKPLVCEQLSLSSKEERKFSKASLVLTASSDPDEPFFLWPVNLDDRSAVEALSQASQNWSTVQWVIKTKGYEVSAAAKRPEPDWPNETLTEIIRTAFDDRIIDRADHEGIERILPKRSKKPSAPE